MLSAALSKVLVIDDSPLARSMVQVALEDAGFAVQTAEDGPQGLQSIHSFGPDVVVCDMQMPMMSGVEVVAQMRKDSLQVPVLIFTESNAVDSAVAAMRQGAFGY